MQKAKNLLLIIPLGSTHFEADLPKVNSPAAKLFCLVFGDVVVENDDAAVLVLAAISLTMPRRVNANASRTPLAVIIPRYWRAIASGVYPAFDNSSASETRIRVPLKIKRPLQTRVSAARCLPISIRAMSVLPPWRSLYQLHNPIKSSPCRMTKTGWDSDAEIGALVSHGIDFKDLCRGAATYVDKVRDQSENSQADRINHSTQRARESG
jgi:hypothetical protein